MKLIVHELNPEVNQTLIPKKNTNVTVVRPHLYIRNRPSGEVRIEIYTLDDALVAVSNKLKFTDITTSNEFHGYVRFDINVYLKKDVQYSFKIATFAPYSFSESAYCGVCSDYDLRKYDTVNPILYSIKAPLDIEVWELTNK